MSTSRRLEHQLDWVELFATDELSARVPKADPHLLTHARVRQKQKEPLWTAFCTGPVLTWQLYHTQPLSAQEIELLQTTMQRDHLPETIDRKFPVNDADLRTQRIGMYGEAAIFAILENFLGGLDRCKRFDSTRLVFRTQEDQDPIDLSFVKDGKFVHFCVKTSSRDKLNDMESSTAFFLITNRDLAHQPRPTLIVRWRISFLDWENPLAGRRGRLTIHYLVHRNFNIAPEDRVQ